MKQKALCGGAQQENSPYGHGTKQPFLSALLLKAMRQSSGPQQARCRKLFKAIVINFGIEHPDCFIKLGLFHHIPGLVDLDPGKIRFRFNTQIMGQTDNLRRCKHALIQADINLILAKHLHGVLVDLIIPCADDAVFMAGILPQCSGKVRFPVNNPSLVMPAVQVEANRTPDPSQRIPDQKNRFDHPPSQQTSV